MGKLYKRQLAQAASQRFSLRKHKKLIGDQGEGWNTGVFQLNGVVDTPRRARASIGKRIDYDVATVNELLNAIGLGAGHFSFGDELNTVASLLQKRSDIAEKLVGIGFAIVQQTNALVAQAAVFPGSELGPFRNSGRSRIHNLQQLSFHAFCPPKSSFSLGRFFLSPKRLRGRSYNE